MLGLRQKLLLAFATLSLLLLGITGFGSMVIGRLSRSSDLIYRENLASIGAAREMRRAAEDINQALLAALWDGAPLDSQTIRSRSQAFADRLAFQRGNITIAGEGEATDSLQASWNRFRAGLAGISVAAGTLPGRRRAYADTALPQYRAILDRTEKIIGMNSANILSADGRAQAEARSARKTLTWLLTAGSALILLSFYLLGKSVLGPIRALTRSAQEIEQGNLDLALEDRSRDELGQLARAFNSMAARLREFRRTDQAKLARTQRTTQTAINSLPDAIAVFNAEGIVELSNESAQRLFGIEPGTRIETTGHDWLIRLFRQVLGEARPFKPEGYQSAVQVFPDGQEAFFLPHLIPLLDESRLPQGITLVLADVTGLRKLDESKSDLLATVSHELKTRLTSIRMAAHLLCDEKVGSLNARQSDLLMTAREDAEKLHVTIEGLLDIGRIRSGNLKMDLRPMELRDMIGQAAEVVLHGFLEKGLKLEIAIEPGTPKALADPSRVHLILANLLSNALKYTPAPGSVEIKAALYAGRIAISVSDTGAGIPARELPRIFEKFYRGTRTGEPGGAGLGLAIAKEVAEAHGGTLTAESAEGAGASFTFTLEPAPGPETT